MASRTPEQYDWDKALFNDRRLTKHFTSPRRSKITHVTLHHLTIVAPADQPLSTVALEGAYRTWQGTREASANYAVSGDLVWQYVSDFDAAWSDANSTSNHSTLSIEHANSTAGPKWQVSDDTFRTGARLVATLHRLYKLGRPSRKTVKVHQDYYATACPGPYMMGRLDEYIALTQEFYDGKPKPPEPETEPVPEPAPTPEPEVPSGSWFDRLVAAIAEALKKLGYTPNTPAPEPEPEPEPPATTSFWGGYGNLYAPYTFTDDWLKRAPKLAAKVKQMGVSWFIALEGHGDTTAAGGDGKVELARAKDGTLQPIYKPFLDALPDSWRVAEGEGGNHLFYDSAKLTVLKTRDALMPGKRWMTGWKVRRIVEAAEFWINAAHLSAGSTPDRVKDREAQGRYLADAISTANPVILGIDRNNATRYTGSPWEVLEKAGLLGLREKSPSVKNGNTPTHHGGKPGQWIDDMHTSASVTVDSAEVVATGDLTDHNWLKARFTTPA